MDQSNQPRPFKRYPQARIQPLPTELPAQGAPATAVLSGRVVPSGGAVDLDLLARLLFFSAGVTRVAEGVGGRTWFRAAASAGNLHPLEVYVATGDVAGLDTGLYHFAPDEFGLEELSPGDSRASLADIVVDPQVAASPLILVVTGIPWRTAWKYGERGWRHVYWDAGTMLANLLAVADGYRLRADVRLGFIDAALCRLLGIDGVAEFPVAVVTVGGTGAVSPAGHRGQAEPQLTAMKVSPAPVELPLTTRIQQAGELATAEEVIDWRTADATVLPSASESVEPPEGASAEPIESVVLRRGSTRRMRRSVAPVELLQWSMAVATRHLPADAIPPGSSLLSHPITVHAVQGVEPGLYHWDYGVARLRQAAPEAEVRRLSGHLCLDQPLGGDSAYTAFPSADLDRIVDRYGERGYRLAQLEAGVVAGRLQLAAFTLGHGGTGLTFFDEDISTAFDTPAACMLTISVGTPAYSAKPGGSPRRPTHLTR